MDGFCESLKLAFEHQGRQHFKRIKKFHSDEKFARNIENDREKREQCKNNNVILIEVPEIPEVLPVFDVLQFIKKECLEQNVNLPPDFDNITIDLTKIYIPETNNRLNEVKELVTKMGGVCLSNSYLGFNERLSFTCSNNHHFELRPLDIKNGKWCPECKKENFIENERKLLEKLANDRGGTCLSSHYIDSKTILKWQCEFGHVWEETPKRIKTGLWCPICKENNKPSILDMKQLAFTKGGQCLSEKYINARTALTWQCNLGHIWQAVPDSIKRGSWCPKCANSKKGRKFKYK